MSENPVFIVDLVLRFSGLLFPILYSACIEKIVEKKREWPGIFLLCLSTVAYISMFSCWLPGRLGIELIYFDEPVADGAFLFVFGVQLLITTVGIVLAILKYFWNVLRHKTEMEKRFVLYELLFAALFAVPGVFLVQSKAVINIRPGTTFWWVVGFLIGGVVLISAYKEILKPEKEGTAGGNATKTADAAGTITVSDQPDGDKGTEKDARKYADVLMKAQRLTAPKDREELIRLLTKATELQLTNDQEAVLWNRLSVAYKDAGNKEKSAECSNTVLQYDPQNPAALNRLALYYAGKKDFDAAASHIERAIDETRKRRLRTGPMIANYALIRGLEGRLEEADELLEKAAAEGCSERTLNAVRKKIPRQS